MIYSDLYGRDGFYNFPYYLTKCNFKRISHKYRPTIFDNLSFNELLDINSLVGRALCFTT